MECPPKVTREATASVVQKSPSPTVKTFSCSPSAPTPASGGGQVHVPWGPGLNPLCRSLLRVGWDKWDSQAWL